MKLRSSWALALLAGVLHTASFAPTEAWPLEIVALGWLAWLARDAGPRAAAALGWWFGFGWLTSGLWWLYISLHRFGGLPAPLAGFAVALLAAGLALYYALALGVWAWWRAARPALPRNTGDPAVGSMSRRATHSAGSAPGFAACWLLAELGRGVLFTGFPWIAGGYAHTSGPLAAWAPWIGVYGIGAVAAWVGAGVALGWENRTNRQFAPRDATATHESATHESATHASEANRLGAERVAGSGPVSPLRRSPVLWTAGLPVLIALAALALPSEFTRDTGRLTVTLLQPNVAQDEKFEPANVRTALLWHQRRLTAARGTLVVTPESSIPLPPQDLDPSWLPALRAPFAHGDRAALVGMFQGNDEVGYVNSVVALSATSDLEKPDTLYRYGKRHLLPFGEFIPPGFKWFVDMLQIPIGDQAHGTSTAALAVGGQRVRPVICYEDLFGEDMVSSVVGPDAATLFANSTNLAWFGTVMVQDQHLQFSRMRALEFQRPMVRATNTGITGVVDYHGVLTARLPSVTDGALETEVHGRIGVTPYARWLSTFGLWPLPIAALAVLLAGGRARRPGRRV